MSFTSLVSRLSSVISHLSFQACLCAPRTSHSGTPSHKHADESAMSTTISARAAVASILQHTGDASTVSQLTTLLHRIRIPRGNALSLASALQTNLPPRTRQAPSDSRRGESVHLVTAGGECLTVPPHYVGGEETSVRLIPWSCGRPLSGQYWSGL